MQKKTYLTTEGFQKLQKEMILLRQVSRKKSAVRIEGAIEEGGTTGDAEYDESKNS